MKKKLIFLMSSVFFIISASVSAFAESRWDDPPEKFNFSPATALKSFAECGSAIIGAVILIVAVILLAVFRNKLKKKLSGSSSGAMLTAFIILFSICSVACLVLALLTDGKSWSDMMHIDNSKNYLFTQFSDYIVSLRSAGSKKFADTAPKFSPLSNIILLALAQFVPNSYIQSTSGATLAAMTRNQEVMLLYLLLVLFTVISMYKMNRMILSKNPYKVRNEIVLVLPVISYPVMYCIELGNIAGISLALAMFFILFRNHEKRVLHETALFLLGISAAITPYTLVFIVLLLFSDKSRKKQIFDTCKVLIYFLALFIVPAIFTGFHNARIYINNLFGISSELFVPGNTSIANLLLFFGVDNVLLLQIITVFTSIVALICMFTLKSQWQKATAAVYIILNIFGASAPQTYIFILIPFILLLAEEKHESKDWLYFLSYSFLIVPIPAWYYFEQLHFTTFLNAFGLDYIPAANSLFATAAVQMLLILMCSQMTTEMKNRKVLKA